jgi:hypothetical protein
MGMVRVAQAAMAILAAPLPMNTAPASDPSHVVINQNCVITYFYGVPLDLKLSSLPALMVDHTRAYYLGEGDYHPEATLLVGRNILLQAEFTDDKEPTLYQLRTSSPSAVGPRGVAIGATLKVVQSKWPEGEFYWTSAHGPYVAFTNGTNLFFEFDPGDMPAKAFDPPPVPKPTATGEWIAPPLEKVVPDPEKLKVTAIRISSGSLNYTCPNSDRKKN